MGILIRTLSVVIALCSSLAIVRSLRRQRMTMGFASAWVGVAVVVVVLGCGGDVVLDPLARLLGVQYPPTLLFLAAIVVLLRLTAHLAVQIAHLDRRLRDVVDLYGRDHIEMPPSAGAGADLDHPRAMERSAPDP